MTRTMPRRLSAIAPDWWDYTTLDRGIIEEAARLTPRDLVRLSRPGFRVALYDTLEDFYLAEALEYVQAWRESTADAPVGICGPIGPTEQLPLIRALGGHHTVLVTSHILGEIERIADRAAILLHGRLLGMHPLGAARRLRVRVRGAAAGLRACLEQTRGVTAVAVDAADGGIAIARADVDGEFVAERLAAAIVAAGLGLLELSSPTHDLESVFLRLTGDNGAGAP